ncbi:hypothetical protein [Chromobacterium sphagni]|nr:hypothetical protein [Chromobacterium sphagni]
MDQLNQQDTDSDLSRKAEQDKKPFSGQSSPEGETTPHPQEHRYFDPVVCDPADEPIEHDLKAYGASNDDQSEID